MARCQIQDAYVSKDHVQMEELPTGEVRVLNLSQKQPIVLPDASVIPPGGRRNLAPPTRLGIGDTFNGRIAGNVVNDDLLGSMEFACAVAGAKAVVVFGHTACGAVKGAIDGVDLGNLTGLLARIKPAITATKFDGEKSSKNAGYVDAVARTNVALTLDLIRRRSPILADLEKKGSISVAGAMYDLATGEVEFLA